MDLTLNEHPAGPGRTVVEVSGEIDVYTAPKLREALLSLVDSGTYRLIVDMSGVEFLDSTGLGVLVGGLKRVRAHDGAIDLVVTQGRILRIFKITGLSKVFTIYDSLDEALASGTETTSPADFAELRREARRARSGGLEGNPPGKNIRRTRPLRGLGPNEVDLRGTRSPCRAISVTAANGTGLEITAVPPPLIAAETASAASWNTGTSRSLSWMPHASASSSRCKIAASRSRHAGEACAGITASRRARSGLVSSQNRARGLPCA